MTSFSRTIAVNTFSQIFAKLIMIAFGICATIVLRRYLGRSFYGDFIFVISLVTMLSTFADFGTHLITVREASQQQEKQTQIIGNVIILRFCFSIIAGLALGVMALVPFFARELSWSLISGIFLLVSISLKNSLLIIFHTKLKLAYFSLMNSLASFIAFIGALVLVFLGADKKPLLFVLNLGLANFLPLLLFFPQAKKMMRINWQINKAIIKRLLGQTAPLAGILLLFTLYSKLDTVILKLCQTSEAVGVYGLTFKIHENLNVLAAYLMNSLLPVFSRWAIDENKQKKFKKIFQLVFDLLVFSGAGLSILIYFLAPLIIRLLTGDFLGSEILSLRILIWATFFSFLNHLMGYSIIALGKQASSFFISALALSFNLLANLIFIPLYSFRAAGVNAVLTQALVLLLSSLVVFKKLKWFPCFWHFPRAVLLFIKKKGRIFDAIKV